MDVMEVVSKAQESLTVKRVFGEPYEKNGLTLIPAAAVQGGGGGGSGTDAEGNGGGGGGFGLSARPAGVYVIEGSTVRWQPALDINRVIAGAQLVAIVALLTLRAMSRYRMKRRRAGQ